MSTVLESPDPQAVEPQADRAVYVVVVDKEPAFTPKHPLDVPRSPRPTGGVLLKQRPLVEVIKHNTQVIRSGGRHWWVAVTLVEPSDAMGSLSEPAVSTNSNGRQMPTNSQQHVPGSTETAVRIRAKCDQVAELLVAKNQAYGDSALNPIGVFSPGKASDLIRVRMDDKLSRIANDPEAFGEDPVMDLMGYLVLFSLAMEDEAADVGEASIPR